MGSDCQPMEGEHPSKETQLTKKVVSRSKDDDTNQYYRTLVNYIQHKDVRVCKHATYSSSLDEEMDDSL